LKRLQKAVLERELTVLDKKEQAIDRFMDLMDAIGAFIEKQK
jgi:hypothetical protein